ncbi:MAG: hypothetical protein KGK07_04950 [Chloroflexota bacterium]|nr:hypothetical protein [Chloroflexota bacterium]
MSSRPRFRTRPVSLLLLAASAGIALWLILPWGHLQGASGAAAGGPLVVDGRVQVRTDGNVVTRLVVPITLRGQQGVSLDGTVLRAETDMSPTAAAAVPAKFSLSWLDGNGDRVIDAGEHVVLTVDLPAVSTVHPGNPLALVFKSTGGSRLTIADVLP